MNLELEFEMKKRNNKQHYYLMRKGIIIGNIDIIDETYKELTMKKARIEAEVKEECLKTKQEKTQ